MWCFSLSGDIVREKCSTIAQTRPLARDSEINARFASLDLMSDGPSFKTSVRAVAPRSGVRHGHRSSENPTWRSVDQHLAPVQHAPVVEYNQVTALPLLTEYVRWALECCVKIVEQLLALRCVEPRDRPCMIPQPQMGLS